MTVLDSNVWIAYLNKNDNQHRKAVNTFNKLDDEILITEYIILEVCSVLTMRVSKATADDFLKIVINNQDVQVLSSSNSFFHKTINYFLDYSNDNLSFVDVSLLKLSRNYELKTFDKKLKNAVDCVMK